MLLSQTAEYALRAVIHLADRARGRPGEWVRVSEVAAATGVPQNYLSKTLNQLARAGILASTRGPAGGFRLAVPAGELTLDRVTGVFADSHPARCLLGTGACGENPGCPVHGRWKPVATCVAAFFATTTIADVTDVVFMVTPGAEGPPGDQPSPPFQTRRGARQESTQ